jgi:hypothetical protein
MTFGIENWVPGFGQVQNDKDSICIVFVQ